VFGSQQLAEHRTVQLAVSAALLPIGDRVHEGRVPVTLQADCEPAMRAEEEFPLDRPDLDRPDYV
jgi:hypothetical protein